MAHIRNKVQFQRIRRIIVNRIRESVDYITRTNLLDSDDADDVADINKLLKEADGDDDDSRSELSWETDDRQSDDERLLPCPPRGFVDGVTVIQEFKMGFDEFDLLMEKFNKQLKDYVVKFELFDGYLYVRSVPGAVHGILSGCFRSILSQWSWNPDRPGLQHQPLIDASDASTYPCFLILTVIDYKYGNVRSKSPDASFIPHTITIPPAKAQPQTSKPGYTGLAYPTVVCEVAHKHENWTRLINDARQKAFARNTNIQVFFGVKLYRHHIRFVWAKRGRNQRGMKIMCTTDKLPINVPTRLFFLVPANLIFWGCPAIPHHITQSHCPFKLEDFRLAVVNLL